MELPKEKCEPVYGTKEWDERQAKKNAELKRKISQEETKMKLRLLRIESKRR